MTAKTNEPQFSTLDRIAATRQILSVALRVVKAKPDVPLNRVARAVTAAVLSKLTKLEDKDPTALSDKQLQTMYDLQAADEILPTVVTMLTEGVRELRDDEVADLLRLADEAKAKRKASADKRKAEKEAKTEGKADAKPKADAKQLAMV